MAYASRIILHTPLADAARLPSFVEACLADRVRVIAVMGPDAERVEDLIDEIVVGDGSDDGRFIVTTAHAGEPLDEVYAFLSTFRSGPDERGAGPDHVEEVRI